MVGITVGRDNRVGITFVGDHIIGSIFVGDHIICTVCSRSQFVLYLLEIT